MSIVTTSGSSPFFHSSPSLFGHLLEPTGNQCVPGTPPPETFHPPVNSFQRMLNGAYVSPVGQIVPVSVHRTEGQGISSAGVYSGSPLLRQILRSGHKRQREEGQDHTSPSPISVSSKRFCQEESRVPTSTSLVVLKRSTEPPKIHKTGDQPQTVPGSPQPQAQRDTETAAKPTTQEVVCESSSTKDEEGADSSYDCFKWFDFFLGDSDKKLTQHEE